MDMASLDDPVNPVDLGAFIDTMSDSTGTSASVVLAMTDLVLERVMRRISDDTGEEW
jgi:hypothetical protein